MKLIEKGGYYIKMRIKEKIEEIERYLIELSDMIPIGFEEYINDIKTKAACERYFEKIIGAVVDLAFLVIKERHLRLPEEDREAFKILAEDEIINEELSIKLQEAKGMKNILAHDYGIVDDKIVFDSIVDELGKDVKEFINRISKLK